MAACGPDTSRCNDQQYRDVLDEMFRKVLLPDLLDLEAARATIVLSEEVRPLCGTLHMLIGEPALVVLRFPMVTDGDQVTTLASDNCRVC